MQDGPRRGATVTFDGTRAECPEPLLPEPSAPAPQQRRLPRRGKTAFAIAGVALASLLMAASVGCGTKAPTAVDTQLASPSATASGETGATLSADKIRTYAPTMEKFKSVDVNTFESLSRDDRLMYSKYLDDTTVANLVYKFRYGENTKNHEFMIDPVVVSPDNTGQEIINDNFFSLQLAYLQYTQSGGGADSLTNSTPDYFNLSDGRKALSSVYYDVGEMNGTNIVTKVYQENVAIQETLTQPNALIGKWTAMTIPFPQVPVSRE